MVWLSAGALLKKEAVTVVEVELKLPLAFSSRVENRFFWKKRKGLVEAGSQQKCF